MAVKRCLVLTLILCLNILCLDTRPARAQGFAGLGANAQGYKDVTPDKTFTFPADHAPHNGYRIEWWYVTANLTDIETGEPLGVQWTLFRSALSPDAAANTNPSTSEPWASPYMYMAHAAITSKSRHLTAERFARGGIGQADITAEPFNAFIDNWRFTSTAEDGSIAQARLNAGGSGFSYDLALTSDKPIILQGDKGYSVKSDSGHASYYYSQPFFDVEGAMTIDGATRSVTGKAWMDREWSSQLLDADQTGWDWFSLHFKDGSKAMLFQLRSDTNAPYFAGTWISPKGDATPINHTMINLKRLKSTPINGAKIPTKWRLRIKDHDVDITTHALNKKSWMDLTFPYWEGPIHFTGTHDGVGYLEMTGYTDASERR